MTPEQFTETLKKACGDNLLAAVLYGSAAAGDGIEGKSDYNVMLVLRDAGLPALKALAAAGAAWLKKGNPPPLVFSRERLLASADTFPIELSDMKDFHRILHGEDPLPGIKVEPAHLRLAVERELKGALILLRESYLASGGGRRALEALMTESLSQFLVLCRAALRLREEKVPASKLACAARLREHADFDAEAFELVHQLRRGEYRGGLDAEALFERYLAAADRLAAAVDGWAAGRP
jgi:predicted nucleotidyltransferase